MKTRTLLASLTTAAAIVGASAGSASAATSAASESVSQNWAGYVVGGSNSNTQFSNVSGSWVQPTSQCSGGQDYAAFWVGIGGSGASSGAGQYSSLGDSGSTSLEQIGTQGDCTGNGTEYYAWYEMVPAAPVQINMTIHPGDHMSASVAVSGSNVTVSVTNHTSRAVVQQDAPGEQPRHLERRVDRRGAVAVRRVGQLHPASAVGLRHRRFLECHCDREWPHRHDLGLELERAGGGARCERLV